MSWDLLAFWLLAAICVVSASGMVAAKNPVHAGVFLGICFVHVAGIFVMLGKLPQAIGQALVKRYVLPLDLLGVLFHAALLGALYLERPED